MKRILMDDGTYANVDDLMAEALKPPEPCELAAQVLDRQKRRYRERLERAQGHLEGKS